MAKKTDMADWNSIFRLQKNAKKEYAILQARLLAILAKADGKVLDIENLTAYTVFQGVDNETLKLVKTEYTTTLSGDNSLDLSMAERSILKSLAHSEKEKLLNYLSKLAVCDGDLHQNESRYLEEVTAVLEFDSKKS